MGFSKKTKLAAALYQGVELDGMHADHIKPRALGGSDDVTNCQILTPKANMQKGAQYFIPREWQKEWFDIWDPAKPSQLLAAVPAAGKTDAVLPPVKKWLDADITRRLIVAVPNLAVRKQWEEKGYLHGVQLQTKEFSGGTIKHGFHGCIVTYQSLPTLGTSLRMICNKVPTVVILDEIHHGSTSEDSLWGQNVFTAFEPAGHKLLLSGTPNRTDCAKLPFANYNENNKIIWDKCYTFTEGMLDGVIRHPFFDYSSGNYTLMRDDGVELTFEVNKDISRTAASKRLRPLINPDGQFCREQLLKAHNKLMEVREHIPDAAAMAMCADKQSAERVARILKEVTGCKPSLITSDEDKSTDTIERFKRAKDEWLVVVRMVSEGTDIPRLQVLVYLTPWTTDLFFIQGIGRVMRVRSHQATGWTQEAKREDRQCYIYLPSDPRLIECAMNIEEMVREALVAEESGDPNPKDPNDPTDPSPLWLFKESKNNGTETVVLGRRHYSPDDANIINELATETDLSRDQARYVFDKWIKPYYKTSETSAPPLPEPLTLEQQIDDLRNQCQRKANALAFILKIKVEEIHRLYKPHKSCGLDDLKFKLNDLMTCIRERRMPRGIAA